jgi:hypothetical protein
MNSAVRLLVRMHAKDQGTYIPIKPSRDAHRSPLIIFFSKSFSSPFAAYDALLKQKQELQELEEQSKAEELEASNAMDVDDEADIRQLQAMMEVRTFQYVCSIFLSTIPTIHIIIFLFLLGIKKEISRRKQTVSELQTRLSELKEEKSQVEVQAEQEEQVRKIPIHAGVTCKYHHSIFFCMPEI